MMITEFEKLTDSMVLRPGFYENVIEPAYMRFCGDKYAFCKKWRQYVKPNLHKYVKSNRLIKAELREIDESYRAALVWYRNSEAYHTSLALNRPWEIKEEEYQMERARNEKIRNVYSV